jgi:hypothetical protein
VKLKPEFRRAALISARILIPLAVLALMLIYRDVVREVVVIPLYYLVWLVENFLNSINQSFLWILLVAAFFIVAISTRPKRISQHPYVDEDSLFKETGDRVAFWALRIIQGRRGYFRVEFDAQIEALTCLVYAYRLRSGPEEIRKRLQAGELELPPEVQAFIRQKEAGSQKTGWIASLLARRKSSQAGSEYLRGLESLLRELENQIEVKHGDEN